MSGSFGKEINTGSHNDDKSSKNAWGSYFVDVQNSREDSVPKINNIPQRIEKVEQKEIYLHEYNFEKLGFDKQLTLSEIKENHQHVWKDLNDIKNIYNAGFVDTKEKVIRFSEHGGHFTKPSLSNIFTVIQKGYFEFYILRKKKKIVAFITTVGKNYQAYKDILNATKVTYDNSHCLGKLNELEVKNQLVFFDELSSAEPGFATLFLMNQFFKSLQHQGYQQGVTEIYNLLTDEIVSENMLGSLPNVSLKLMHNFAPAYLGYFNESINQVLQFRNTGESLPIHLKRNIYQFSIDKCVEESRKILERRFRMKL